MFSTLLGYSAKKISAQNDRIYTITTRQDSLTGLIDSASCRIIIGAACEAVDFLKTKGKGQYGKGLAVSFWLKLFRINKKESLLVFPKIVNACGVTYLLINLPRPLFF